MPPQEQKDNVARLARFAQATGTRQGTDPGFEFSTMISNMGPSLRKNIGDFVSAVTNPIDTATAMGKTAGGYMSKAGIPGLENYTPYADAMNDFFRDRYGSTEAFLNTVETDPVGALADLSTIFTGVGGAGRAVTSTGGTANRVASQVSRVGNVIDPVNQSLNVVQAPLGALIPESVPQNLYASGVKPSSTLSATDRANVLQTGLDEGIMPTPAGVRKLDDLITGFGRRVDNLIEKSIRDDTAVDATVLFDDLADLENTVSTTPRLNREGDLEAIAKVRSALANSIYRTDDIDANTPPKLLNARELQSLKQQAYAAADYGMRALENPMSNQALQAVGRSARRGVETAVDNPELTALNRRLGGLLEARPVIERASGVTQNRNFINLPGLLGASAGYGAAGDPFAAAALGTMGSLAGRIPQAAMGIGLNRMRQIPRRPVQSFGGQFPAPFRDTGRGLMYSGRAQEGMRNRGLIGR